MFFVSRRNQRQFLRPFGAPDIALTLRGMPRILNQSLTKDFGLEGAWVQKIGLEGGRLQENWGRRVLGFDDVGLVGARLRGCGPGGC